MPMSQFHSRKIRDEHSSFTSHKIKHVAHKPVRQTGVADGKAKKQSGNFFSRRSSKNIRQGGFWAKILKRSLPFLLAGIFLFGIFIIGAFAWYSRDLPDPYKIMDRTVALSTKIYDRTGEVLLYEVHGPEKRTLISLDELPDYVKESTIAIEDKNFYEHGGISIRGIIRGQIITRLRGKRTQGGSTLTQQFVKNAILTNERKISRKIKEWILSYRIEQKFSKDEILQLYLNEIPYGSSAYGVEAAALYYFNKVAKELTLAEAAVLAALPQAPSYYSPYGNNKDELINRQHTVLNLMVDQGYIIEEEAEAAKQQELVFKKRAENIKAPHFVMYVKELLEQQYGTTIIEQGGWKIITSLDWGKQQKAEEIINEIAETNLERYEASNAALVALDVETSEILSMVGSKDYFNDEIDGQVNVAISERQPGSSLKPLVYLTAFSKGYRPNTVIFDLVTNFAAAGDDYTPHNYDLEERGPVTMRQALAGSLNIPAVKTLYLAGVYNVLDMAESFGYTTLDERDRYGLSLVLGGGEVKLLEHVNTYAGFAREGVYKDSVAILKIEDSEGKIIEEIDENKGRRVIDKKFVRTLNNVLSDNEARSYVFGEFNNLTLPDRPVAAKTGTTNDYRDAWTIGFTPNIAVGVWVGNNDNAAMKEGASGSSVAAPIWNRFMREVTSDLPIKFFKAEELGDCDKPMVCGGFAEENIVLIDKASGKLATEYTPYTQIEERKYLEVHNILHYVNTNDPLGDPLSDPNKDSQYSLWEEAVFKWVDEQGFYTGSPVKEYDDIHLPENQP
ncbi:MAG TPA: penicillin-binding protein, partial [Bacteroidetes bacterium]|nr:penicillin-binding protein [Bacteroidota bacterium]